MKYKLKKRRPLKRIYHDYRDWECYKSGMYEERKRDETDAYIQLAINLLRDPIRLKENMISACMEWFYSSQNHLTIRNSNRQAVLGRFACCYAHGITETETRIAWSFLTEEERSAANKVADEVILLWEEHHFNHEDTIRTKRTGCGTGKN